MTRTDIACSALPTRCVVLKVAMLIGGAAEEGGRVDSYPAGPTLSIQYQKKCQYYSPSMPMVLCIHYVRPITGLGSTAHSVL